MDNRKKTKIIVLTTIIFLFSISCFSAKSYAGIIWNESTSGDLSNNTTLPINLPVLNAGDNRIVGSIGTWWCSDDADVASFVVPDGYILTNLILESYNCGTYYDYVPFSFYRGSSTDGELIEFMLLAEFGAGTDLLQFDSMPGPQSAGAYTFEFNSIQSRVVVDERSTYSVNLILCPAPEPATLILLGLGSLALIRKRKSV